MTEQLSVLLANLPEAEPGRPRADRIRSRCHRVLARRQRRAASGGSIRRVWEPMVAGLGGLYLAAVIAVALQVYGLL